MPSSQKKEKEIEPLPKILPINPPTPQPEVKPPPEKIEPFLSPPEIQPNRNPEITPNKVK